MRLFNQSSFYSANDHCGTPRGICHRCATVVPASAEQPQKRQGSARFSAGTRSGFSLIEVVLAIGIFLVTVLALVGLLGPTLTSVGEVEKTDEVASVVNTVNAFLQNSPDIAPNASKFNAIYTALKGGNHTTIFVFREFIGTGTDARIRIGFAENESGVDDLSKVSDFSNAAGPIYRVVLSASSVTPLVHRSPERVATQIYTLTPELAAYPEGYLAMEVRIFAREQDMQVLTTGTMPTVGLAQLAGETPMFTYNMAIVR